MNPISFLPPLPTFAAVPVAGVGLYQLVRGTWMMWEGDGSSEWPFVDGVVQRVRIESRTRASANVSGIPIATKQGGYEVIIEYAYQVAGRVYASDRWSFRGGWLFAEEADAEKKVRQYREATQVTVYYDPEDPARSVLSTGDANVGVTKAGWGAVVLLYAVYCVLSQ